MADSPVVDSPVAGIEPAEDAPAMASRRSVLMAGAGALGLAGVVAACGTDTPAPSGAGAPSAGPTNGSPAATGEATASPGASGTAAGTGPSTIAKSDIPVGGGKIYDDIRVVVTQPADGTFKAFDSLCTHMGCVVTSVFSGKINCPCHMSQFSVADGSVIQGPANRGLDKKTVTDNGATITIT